MSCPRHHFQLPIDTADYLLIYTDKGKMANYFVEDHGKKT